MFCMKSGTMCLLLGRPSEPMLWQRSGTDTRGADEMFWEGRESNIFKELIQGDLILGMRIPGPIAHL